MRLRLDLCDIDLQLKINGWQKSENAEDWDDNWCDVELSLKSKYINYDPSGEILMSGEVLWICNVLEDLLSGKMEEDAHLRFAEPDIEFNFRVAKRLYDIPGKVIYRDGYKDVDIDGDWIINFWCKDGLGANSLCMGLDRNDLVALSIYLKLVTGKIGKGDPCLLKLCESGILLPE